jgi:hypothetical protein
MNGLRVKDVNYLHINFQTQQTQVSNILGFFRHRQEIESIVAAKDRSWLVKNFKNGQDQGDKAQNQIGCCYRLLSQK